MARLARLVVLLAFAPACFNPMPMTDETDAGSSSGMPGTTTSPGTTGPGTTTDDPGTTEDPSATTTSESESGSTSVADTGTTDTTGVPDPCADDPCDHGTCVPEGDAPSCTCDEGWAGDLCDACDDGYELSGDECVLVLTCAADPCGPMAMCADDTGVVICTRVFTFTGADQPWMVPPGVMSVDAIARGASGGCGLAGLGGEASATIPVLPGDQLHVMVGGVGACGLLASLPGGYNGGGDKFTDSGNNWEGGSGGGATDLRRGGVGLNDRVLVAGGGGGRGWGGQAGHGGGVMGETCDGVGGGCGMQDVCGGRGGSQVAGGIGGFCTAGCEGQAGTLGQGGASDGCAAAGGGGGGGYYGGGGGAHCSGGGGSSRVDFPGNSDTATVTGVNAGDGELVLSWSL